ncbi:energy-coupling factor transporter transmembrane component T [Arcanobacterium ihumii]|uniref:energy-coupling factor transporter transmembrane component T n=1 Tax=Arcanobacterium ihumii TaxID=2138162 RepID=UPI000F540392|nr:energy-coupling factor transporter transmembrane component T [Arcanobacterium ihumii]
MPDPRTTIIALLTISTTIYGARSPLFVWTAASFVAALLIWAYQINRQSMHLKYLLTYGLAFGFFYFGSSILPAVSQTTISAFISVFFAWMCRMTVVAGMGLYAIVTIKPAILQVALARSHVPSCFTIPLSVSLRILPTIFSETRAVIDAMRLRLNRIVSLKSAEYFTIPLVSTVVRSGDELAAAALIRGLGGPIKPTSVIEVKFRAIDAILLCIILVFIVWRFFEC